MTKAQVTALKASKKKVTKKDIVDMLLLMLCVPVLIIGMVVTLSMMQSKKMGNVPSFFGYSFLQVQTGSMYPMFNIGDTIMVKQVSVSEIAVGDVISFHRGSRVITHMVHSIRTIKVEGVEQIAFETYGIANDDIDSSLVLEKNLVGKFYKMGGAADIVEFLSGRWGMVLCVIFPLGVIIISDILTLYGLSKEIKDEKFDVYYKYRRQLNLIDKNVDDYAIVKQVSADGHVQYVLAPSTKQDE